MARPKFKRVKISKGSKLGRRGIRYRILDVSEDDDIIVGDIHIDDYDDEEIRYEGKTNKNEWVFGSSLRDVEGFLQDEYIETTKREKAFTRAMKKDPIDPRPKSSGHTYKPNYTGD